MNRDKSVTVTRDTRDKTDVTFGVSHGTPTRPVPTRPISISYVCLWLLVVETLILNIISQRAREMMTMTDWTPEELAAEAERRAAYEATGMCPDSGYTIEICWAVELCDCAYGAPDRCPQCGVAVWDLGEHERRQHP